MTLGELTRLLLDAERSEIVVTLENDDGWAMRLAAWLSVRGVPLEGAGREESSEAPLRSLLNEAVVNYHDYIGQTVYGIDWVKRARAALNGEL